MYLPFVAEMEAVFEDVVCPLAMALLPPFLGKWERKQRLVSEGTATTKERF